MSECLEKVTPFGLDFPFDIEDSSKGDGGPVRYKHSYRQGKPTVSICWDCSKIVMPSFKEIGGWYSDKFLEAKLRLDNTMVADDLRSLKTVQGVMKSIGAGWELDRDSIVYKISVNGGTLKKKCDGGRRYVAATGAEAKLRLVISASEDGGYRALIEGADAGVSGIDEITLTDQQGEFVEFQRGNSLVVGDDPILATLEFLNGQQDAVKQIRRLVKSSMGKGCDKEITGELQVAALQAMMFPVEAFLAVNGFAACNLPSEFTSLIEELEIRPNQSLLKKAKKDVKEFGSSDLVRSYYSSDAVEGYCAELMRCIDNIKL